MQNMEHYPIMALIACVTFDTTENGRTELTRQCLKSLARTVDWSRHELYLVDNGSVPETVEMLTLCGARKSACNDLPPAKIILNATNLGTARAVNKAWQYRKPGQACLKIDNDVYIHEIDWLERLEECIAHDAQIGIIGLKRKDVQLGAHGQPELVMLPHKPGERWLIVEKAIEVMGTCQLYASALLDRIGYLVQFGLYGLDDSLAAVRCRSAGFYSCYYPHVEIDHLDVAGTHPKLTPYQLWKQDESDKHMQKFHLICQQYLNGTRSVWHDSDVDLDNENL